MMLYQDGMALCWRFDDERVRIEPWGTNALRVRASLLDALPDEEWALLPACESVAEIHIEEERASIRNGEITAYCDREGRLSFENASGRTLLREFRENKPFPDIKGREWRPILQGNFELTVRFESNPDEKLFGMGEYQYPMLNLKGASLELAQRNTQASIPFTVSNQGYGFLWNNPAIGEADFATNVTKWHARETKAMDYWICAGDSPKQIVRTYEDATGKPPMLPEFALDLIQSKLRYLRQEELLEIAREYKRRGLQLGTIVVDFIHWTYVGSYDFDKRYWPDPDALVKELHDMGINVMTSFWPAVDPKSLYYQEMMERGLFIRANRGERYHLLDNQTHIDVTNPETRDFVWSKHRKEHFNRGIANYFSDSAEPELHSVMMDSLRFAKGNGNEVANCYPFYYAKMFSDNLAKEGVSPFNIARCAWAGSQRFGSMLWSGDIESTFEVFRIQICIALNVGLAGQPWFTTDTGGFFNSDIESPYFRELMCRWFQFSVFTPVLRMHGMRSPTRWTEDGLFSGAGNELWSFGEETYEILKMYLDIRQRIKPYIRDVMREAHEYGDPAIRAMFYEFPSDERCWGLQDQYMFGSDLLVAPVVYEKAESRAIYLPAPCDWVDVWTGQIYTGGQQIVRDCPLDLIPVYARHGANILESFRNA